MKIIGATLGIYLLDFFFKQRHLTFVKISEYSERYKISNWCNNYLLCTSFEYETLIAYYFFYFRMKAKLRKIY